MAVNKNKEFTEFSPAEIEAMRYAYLQMVKEFPGRYIGENEKLELARSILEVLERADSREAEEEVLKLVNEQSL
jgi:hypothetical protein